MGLRNLKLNQYTDRAGQVVQMGQLAGTTLPLETRLLGRDEALDFAVEKVGDNRFVGQASFAGLAITKSVEVVPDQYLLRYHVSVKGRAPGFLGLSTFLTEELETPARGSSILPHLDKQEFFVDTVETHDRVAFAPKPISIKSGPRSNSLRSGRSTSPKRYSTARPSYPTRGLR